VHWPGLARRPVRQGEERPRRKLGVGRLQPGDVQGPAVTVAHRQRTLERVNLDPGAEEPWPARFATFPPGRWSRWTYFGTTPRHGAGRRQAVIAGGPLVSGPPSPVPCPEHPGQRLPALPACPEAKTSGPPGTQACSQTRWPTERQPRLNRASGVLPGAARPPPRAA